MDLTMWPTPHAHEARLGYQRRPPGKKGTQQSFSTAVILAEGGREATSGLQVTPEFTEWVMGFPPGWTDLEESETPSSPSVSKNSADSGDG